MFDMKDRSVYKVINTINGEIYESNFRKAVIDKAHELMSDYKEMYNKEFYLDCIDSRTYKLKEYKLRCPYCTNEMSEQENKIYNMCQECWDNNVE